MEKISGAQPEQFLAENTSHLSTLRRGRTVSLVACAALLVSGCELTGSPDSQPIDKGRVSATPLPPHTPGCLQPTVQELIETRKQLNSPDAPQVVANGNYNSAKLLPDGAPLLGDADFRYWQHVVANNHGFNLADSPTGKGSQLSHEERDALAKNPHDALAGLSIFAKNYSLGIAIPVHQSELKGLDVSPVSNELVSGGYEVGSSIMKLRDELEKYPTDMFKRLGINKIALVKGNEDVELPNGKKINVGGQVHFKYHRDTIFVDIYSADVLDHEIWHTADFAMGCGTYSDVAYTELNDGVAIYANETPKDVYSASTFWKKNQDRKNRGLPQLDPADVYTTTDYGLTNELEDKAEVGKHLTDGQAFAEVCTRGEARVKSKAVLLLARLRKWYPGFGSYLMSTGDHCSIRSD